MTTTKKISINIALLVIVIAISTFVDSVAAQESGRLFLLPGESPDVRAMESDGAVTSFATINKFRIASYNYSDKRISYPVERQWSDGRDKQSDDQQSGNTEIGAVLQWWHSPGTNEDGSIDAPVKLSFANTGTDADVFNLDGNNGWYLPNMKNLYASIDIGISLPSFYGGTASGSVFDWEDPLAWKEEKNNKNEAGFSKWSLPDNAKLKLILKTSLFPDMTGFAVNRTMFNTTPVSNAAGQNHYTGSGFDSGRPFMISTGFSFLSARENGQAHYWSSNFYNDGTAYDEMDSAYDVNVFTIDTQGRITGITKKIKGLLP